MTGEAETHTALEDGDRVRVYLDRPTGYGDTWEEGFFRGRERDSLGRVICLHLEVAGEQVELGVPPEPLNIVVNWDHVLYMARLA